MNKKIVAFFSTVLALSSLAGCGESKCEHKYVTKFDSSDHWQVCEECDKETGRENHTLVSKYDENFHWEECECGYKTAKAPHDLSSHHDDDKHWKDCPCGYVSEKVDHDCSTIKFDATHHWHACECGEIEDKEEHTLTWQGDGPQHWQVCECGYQSAKATHVYNVQDNSVLAKPATCTEPAEYYYTCVCGDVGIQTYTCGDATGHSYNYKGECVHDGCTESILDNGAFDTNNDGTVKNYVARQGINYIKVSVPTTRFAIDYTTCSVAKIQKVYNENGTAISMTTDGKVLTGGTLDEAGDIYIGITAATKTTTDYFRVIPDFTDSFASVSDVFDITNRGIVANIKGISGKIAVGQKIAFVHNGSLSHLTVSEIEVFKKEFDEVNLTENSSIGLMFEEITEMAQINAGDLIGNIKAEDLVKSFDFRGYILSKAEGGRNTPFFSGYRPQMYYCTSEFDATNIVPGVAIQISSKEPNSTDLAFFPGEAHQLTATVLNEGDYIVSNKYTKNLLFRESGKTVIAGYVAEYDATVTDFSAKAEVADPFDSSAIAMPRCYKYKNVYYRDLALTKQLYNGDADFKYTLIAKAYNDTAALMPSFDYIAGRGTFINVLTSDLKYFPLWDIDDLVTKSVYLVNASGETIKQSIITGIDDDILGRVAVEGVDYHSFLLRGVTLDDTANASYIVIR